MNAFEESTADLLSYLAQQEHKSASGLAMKIEHDFRDSKDPKWGLGIRASRTVEPARLQVQLLIGFLAAILLRLISWRELLLD